ncbi:MAG: cytochrome c peroxidase, partial [Chloroflexota bacterium]
RISVTNQGEFQSPANDDLPNGLESILAVQAMFPVTSRDEMRGEDGDIDIYGEINEVGQIDDEDLPKIWQKLTDRLLAIPVYQAYFKAAYPDTPLDQIGFKHAANAIAAFEAEAFSLLDSPWNQYLNGDLTTLTLEQKQGAILFFSEARCGECHTGNLLTDQKPHNIGVPQVGPGKGDAAPLDFGRALVTKSPADRFAFRTPSLHNVALTSPYMHDGAYHDLEAVVRHHLSPTKALYNYDPEKHLTPDLVHTFQNQPELLAATIEGLDYTVVPKRVFTDQEINTIVAFLNALTDPAATQLGIQPETVPSGLPVQD